MEKIKTFVYDSVTDSYTEVEVNTITSINNGYFINDMYNNAYRYDATADKNFLGKMTTVFRTEGMWFYDNDTKSLVYDTCKIKSVVWNEERQFYTPEVWIGRGHEVKVYENKIDFFMENSIMVDDQKFGNFKEQLKISAKEQKLIDTIGDCLKKLSESGIQFIMDTERYHVHALKMLPNMESEYGCGEPDSSSMAVRSYDLAVELKWPMDCTYMPEMNILFYPMNND